MPANSFTRSSAAMPLLNGAGTLAGCVHSPGRTDRQESFGKPNAAFERQKIAFIRGQRRQTRAERLSIKAAAWATLTVVSAHPIRKSGR